MSYVGYYSTCLFAVAEVHENIDEPVADCSGVSRALLAGSHVPPYLVVVST